MINSRVFKIIKGIFISGIIAVGCQQVPLQQPEIIKNQKTISPHSSRPSENLHAEILEQTLALKSKTATISFNIHFPRSTQFKTQALDCQEIKAFKLEINGIGIDSAIYANGVDAYNVVKTFTLPPNPNGSSCAINLSASNIPFGKNRVVTLKAMRYNGNPLVAPPLPIPGAEIMGVFDVGPGANLNPEISYRTTPLGLLLKHLKQSNNQEKILLASRSDKTPFQNFLDSITGVTGVPGNYVYSKHPALINYQALADDLFQVQGDISQLDANNSAYLYSTRTVSGNAHLSGFSPISPLLNLDVRVKDPSSSAFTQGTPSGSIPFNIGAVPPANWALEGRVFYKSGAHQSAKRILINTTNTNVNQDVDFSNVPYIDGYLGVGGGAGAPSDTITLTGGNLAGVSEVKIGEVQANNVSVAGSNISFDLPPFYPSAPITIKHTTNLTAARMNVPFLNVLNFDMQISRNPAPSLPSATNISAPRVVYNTQDQVFLMVWAEKHPGPDYDIKGRLIDKDGLGLGAGEFVINTTMANDQNKPDVAYNPDANEFLVVWEHDIGSGENEIRGRRFTFDGTNALVGVGASDFSIVNSPGTEDLNAPSVGYSETGIGKYMLSWHIDDGLQKDMQCARANNSGDSLALGATQNITSTTGTNNNESLARFAYNPNRDHFFGLYKKQTSGGDNMLETFKFDPVTNTATILGQLLDSPTNSLVEKQPAIAFNSDQEQFILATAIDLGGGNHDIKALRVKYNEVSGDPTQIVDPTFIDIATGADNQKVPAITYSTSDKSYMIAFENATLMDVMVQRVMGSEDGLNNNAVIGDNTTITLNQPALQGRPVIIHKAGSTINAGADPEFYFLGWVDERDPPGAPPASSWIYGQLIAGPLESY